MKLIAHLRNLILTTEFNPDTDTWEGTLYEPKSCTFYNFTLFSVPMGALIAHLLCPEDTRYDSELPTHIVPQIEGQADVLLKGLGTYSTYGYITFLFEDTSLVIIRDPADDLFSVRTLDGQTGDWNIRHYDAQQLAAIFSLMIGGEAGAAYDDYAHSVADPLFDGLESHFRLIP